jgi:hypothetical protein
VHVAADDIAACAVVSAIHDGGRGRVEVSDEAVESERSLPVHL